MDKTQIKHLVGLIQHQMARLAQIDRTAIHQIDQTAGGGHQDIGAACHHADLTPDGLTTDDGGDLDLGVEGEMAQAVRDLVHQFARWRKDQRARCPCLRAGVRLHQMRDKRQAKGQRLARAGLRKAKNIMPFHRKRDRLVLDRGRFVKATGLERVEQNLVQAQHIEIEQFISFRAPHHANAIDQGPRRSCMADEGATAPLSGHDRQNPA